MEQIAAIVVTYNRKELLHQCIEKLLAQQKAACDILIVDNASTDGTGAEVQAFAKHQPHLFYRNTGANLGGAGGFNFGVRWAVETGYSYLWLMDDDTLPCPNALAELWNAHKQLQGNYGWLSSKCLWLDGALCPMNIQRATPFQEIKSFAQPLVPAQMASFVSLFLKAETVRKFGLPIKEFFIWTDDWEFTRRISRALPSYVIADSTVVHAMKENKESNIAIDSSERINRYYYAFRNEAYVFRREGIHGMLYYYLKCFWNVVRILICGKNNRILRWRCIFKAINEQKAFYPLIEYLKA
ncbi:MAG: glycosyltransferase family 2 protein [Ruthenibacterium sp.]